MSLRNRLGNYLVFMAAIALFVFFASLFSPNVNVNLGALVIGVLFLFFGWPMSRARGAAPPPMAKAAPPKPAGPAPRPAGPTAKKRGPLTTLLRGPAKKAAPPPPPPPPPPRKKGLAGLFQPKRKRK